MTSFRSSRQDTRRFLALGLDQPLYLDMELPRRLFEADIALVRVVAILTVVDAVDRPVHRRLGGEVETRRENLLHEETGGDRLQRIVDRFGDRRFGCIRLRNQIGKAGVGFPRCIPGRPTDDLDDLGQAGPVADGQRMFAPQPVEALLGHAKGDNDIDMVAVVFLRRVLQRGGDPVPFSSVRHRPDRRCAANGLPASGQAGSRIPHRRPATRPTPR